MVDHFLLDDQDASVLAVPAFATAVRTLAVRPAAEDDRRDREEAVALAGRPAAGRGERANAALMPRIRSVVDEQTIVVEEIAHPRLGGVGVAREIRGADLQA